MPTTPTSMINRLMGTETWTDAVNFGSVAHIFGGAVQFTGTPVFSSAGIPIAGAIAPVVIAPATTTLVLTAASHANRLLNIASTGGLAVTPPAATGTGNVYTFCVTATISGGNFTIDPKAGNASDLASGVAWMCLSGGTTTSTFPTAANTNFMTFNGTTLGGVKGSFIQMWDIATNLWIVSLELLQTSTAATPFSNH